MLCRLLLIAGLIVAVSANSRTWADEDKPAASKSEDEGRPDAKGPPRRGPPPADAPRSERDHGPRGPGGPPSHDPQRGGPPPRGDGHRGPHHGPPDGPGHRYGADFRDRDPEMAKLFDEDFELERRTQRLADDYRSARNDEERTKARSILQDAVKKHFEVRQQRRTLELKRLEEQLERLRESVAKRAEQEKEIIDARLRELIGDADDVGF